mgnify:CR=1 FL=1
MQAQIDELEEAKSAAETEAISLRQQVTGAAFCLFVCSGYDLFFPLTPQLEAAQGDAEAAKAAAASASKHSSSSKKDMEDALSDVGGSLLLILPVSILILLLILLHSRLRLKWPRLPPPPQKRPRLRLFVRLMRLTRFAAPFWPRD